MKTNTPTLAERPNDVTIMYGAMGNLGRLTNEMVARIGEGVGAKVTGSGSSGKFEEGMLVEGPVVVKKTFTVDGDGPAHEFLRMMKELGDFGPGETNVDVRMSGSVTGYPPKVTDSGIVIPRGPAPEDIDPDDVRHTAVVTVEADITEWMAGASAEEAR